jgi:Protein of unknown function (DUF3253)
MGQWLKNNSVLVTEADQSEAEFAAQEQARAEAEALRQRIRDIVLVLMHQRGHATFAPSLVAQQVTDRRRLWRDLMPMVREELIYMAHQGLIGFYIKQNAVTAHGLRGIYRVGLPDGASEPYLRQKELEEMQQVKRTRTPRPAPV